VGRYNDCQVFDQKPYKSSVGNIFKDRRWGSGSHRNDQKIYEFKVLLKPDTPASKGFGSGEGTWSKHASQLPLQGSTYPPSPESESTFARHPPYSTFKPETGGEIKPSGGVKPGIEIPFGGGSGGKHSSQPPPQSAVKPDPVKETGKGVKPGAGSKPSGGIKPRRGIPIGGGKKPPGEGKLPSEARGIPLGEGILLGGEMQPRGVLPYGGGLSGGRPLAGGLWPWHRAGYGWPVVIQGGNYDPGAVRRQINDEWQRMCQQHGWDYQGVKDAIYGRRGALGRMRGYGQRGWNF
jgi:hypothetical protein